MPLYLRIIIGMFVGLLAGWLLQHFDVSKTIVDDWILPFGTIFIKLLKMIAVPLIFCSLIKGITDLKDLSKFSQIGIKTIGMYLCTTVIAIVIGLVVVNTIAPGSDIPAETQALLSETYQGDSANKILMAKETKAKGPLQFILDIVPDNIIAAATNNKMMLQVIFFSVLFGVALLLIPKQKSSPVIAVIDGINDVILKMVDIIMLYAPFGVAVLLLNIYFTAPDKALFWALGKYGFSVILGLFSMIGVYLIFVQLLGKTNPLTFLKGIAPAQLLAFSTSSSAATLPLTIERVQEHLGVSKKVSGFVLPIGATVNMDGTSLYQAIAAVFIAQVLGIDLTIGQQLTILSMSVLASIGSAAVPSAGVLMLVIVLEAINVPAAGIALILALDRPLDMVRTMVNVTGDATIALIVAKQDKEELKPNPKNWDDLV